MAQHEIDFPVVIEISSGNGNRRSTNGPENWGEEVSGAIIKVNENIVRVCCWNRNVRTPITVEVGAHYSPSSQIRTYQSLRR